MKKIIIMLLAAASLFASCSKDDGAAIAPNGNTSGQGGSLARFTIAQNHLYIVDGQKLYTYSLANNQHPQLKGSVDIGWNIETIYPYRDKLFIGSQNAMYVYSIADPDLPAVLGTASHVRSCDPVVANDSMAYVTVRTGTPCGGNTNALLVYNINDIMNPSLYNTVPLTSPWGLGIKDNRLYVCNGSSGLNVYDLTDPAYPKAVRKITDNTFYDVIITPDDLLIAMVQGGTAIYQIGAGGELELQAKIAQ